MLASKRPLWDGEKGAGGGGEEGVIFHKINLTRANCPFFNLQDAAGKVEGTVNEETAHEREKSGPSCFGRDTDLSWLHSLTRLGGVVSVWGMSGVGKSFLIRQFFNNYMRQSSKNTVTRNPYYDKKKFGWVDVPRPRPFDLRDLSKSLHSELNPAFKDEVMSTIKDPIQQCREYLQREENWPYLIVIDGLQSKEEWDSIRRNMDFKFNTSSGKSNRSGEKVGNVVIIITNEESVANYCATKNNNVWNVKGLEVTGAIKLFDQVYIYIYDNSQ